MDCNHKAASSSRVDRPFRFGRVQISREESKQSAQTIEDDHGSYALLRLRGATSTERLLVSQPFTATLAVSVRALIGCTTGGTKHFVGFLILKPKTSWYGTGRGSDRVIRTSYP